MLLQCGTRPPFSIRGSTAPRQWSCPSAVPFAVPVFASPVSVLFLDPIQPSHSRSLPRPQKPASEFLRPAVVDGDELDQLQHCRLLGVRCSDAESAHPPLIDARQRPDNGAVRTLSFSRIILVMRNLQNDKFGWRFHGAPRVAIGEEVEGGYCDVTLVL